MKKIISLISLIFILVISGYSQTDAEYSKKLKEMFEVAGTEATYQMAIDQMFVMFKQQYSNVDENIWDGLKEEFSKTSLNDLTEMLVPVYKKHLTISDLNKLIEFYQSPTGKKFAESSPLIMQESMQVGQAWGLKIGQEFNQKMEKKGY